MVTEDQFAFHFTPAEYSRIRKIVNKTTAKYPPWKYALLWGLNALNLTGAIMRRHWELAAFYFLCLVFFTVFWIRSNKTGRLAVEGDLRLSASGFVGTLDNTPAQIDWSDIENICDIDDSIVIFRRKDLGPVAIPKSSIADIASLWTVLEDRLVSKRGLVRSPAPRSRILNSAY